MLFRDISNTRLRSPPENDYSIPKKIPDSTALKQVFNENSKNSIAPKKSPLRTNFNSRNEEEPGLSSQYDHNKPAIFENEPREHDQQKFKIRTPNSQRREPLTQIGRSNDDPSRTQIYSSIDRGQPQKQTPHEIIQELQFVNKALISELKEIKMENEQLKDQMMSSANRGFSEAETLPTQEDNQKAQELAMHLRRLQQENDDLKDDLLRSRDYVQRLENDYENRIAQLQDQIEGTRIDPNLVERLQDEIESMKAKNSSLENHLQFLAKGNVETENYRLKLANAETDNKDLHSHLERLNALVEKKTEELALNESNYKKVLQSKISEIEALKEEVTLNDGSKIEIQKLKETLAEKNKEIDFLNETLAKIKNDLNETQEAFEHSKKAIKARERNFEDILKSNKDEQESRLTSLFAEIERLQQENQNLSAKINQLENEKINLEKRHLMQIENMKSDLTGQADSKLTDEISNLNAKLHAEKSGLEFECNNLKARIEDLSKKENEFRIEAAKFRKESLEKGIEVETWKKKYQVLEEGFQKEREGFEREIEYRSNEKAEKEKHELSLKFAQEKVALENIVSGLNNKCQDYERRFVLLSIEIERLQTTNQDTSNETEKIRKELQEQHENALNTLKQDFENALKGRVEKELEVQHLSWKKERKTLQKQQEEQNKKIKELEKALNSQLEEKNKVQGDLKDELIMELNIKNILFMTELERLGSIIQVLSQELEAVNQDNVMLVATIDKLAPSAHGRPVSNLRDSDQNQLDEQRIIETEEFNFGDQEGRTQQGQKKSDTLKRSTREDMGEMTSHDQGQEPTDQTATIRRIVPERGVKRSGFPGDDDDSEDYNQVPKRSQEDDNQQIVPQLLQELSARNQEIQNLQREIDAREKDHQIEKQELQSELQFAFSAKFENDLKAITEQMNAQRKQLEDENVILVDRISKMEVAIHFIDNENAKLSDALKTANEENSVLAAKIRDTLHELDSLVSQKEELQHLFKTKDDEIAKQKLEIQNLTDQNSELAERLREYKDGIDALKNERALLGEDKEKIINEWFTEVKSLEEKLSSLKKAQNGQDEQINSLSAERNQLQIVLEHLKQVVGTQERRIETLEVEKQQLTETLENLKQVIHLQENQMNDLTEKKRQLSETLEQLKELTLRQEEQTKLLSDEKTQLLADMQELEVKYNEMKAIESENTHLSQTLDQLKEIIARQEDEARKLDEEKTQLIERNRQLEAMHQEQENEITAIKADNSYLKQTIEKLQFENQSLAQALSEELCTVKKELSNKDEGINSLVEENSDLKTKIHQHSEYIKELIEKNSALSGEIEQHKLNQQAQDALQSQELKNLSEALSVLEGQRDSFYHENEQLKKNIDKLEGIARGQEQTLKELNEDNQKLTSEIQRQQSVIKDAQRQLTEKNNHLERELEDKVQIIDQLKKQNNSLSADFEISQKSLENLGKALLDEKSSNEILTQTLKALQQTVRDLEERLASQDDHIQALYKQKDSTLNDWDRIRSEHTISLQENRDLRNALEDTKKLIQDNSSENQQLRELIKSLETDRTNDKLKIVLLCIELNRLAEQQIQQEAAFNQLDQALKQTQYENQTAMQNMKDVYENLLKTKETDMKNSENLLNQKLNAKTEKIKQLEQENRDLVFDLKTANQEVARLKSLIEEQKNNFDHRLSSACSELKAQMQEAFKHQQSLDEQAVTKREESLKDQMRKLEETIRNLNYELGQSNSDRNAFAQENTQLKNQLQNLQDQLINNQKNAEKEYTEMVEKLRQSKDQEVSQVLKQVRDEADKMLKIKDNEINALKDSHNEAVNFARSKDSEIKALSQELQKSRQAEDQKAQEIKNLKGQIQDMEKAFQTDMNQLVQSMDKIKAQEIEKVIQEKQQEKMQEFEQLRVGLGIEFKNGLEQQKAAYDKARQEDNDRRQKEINLLTEQLEARRHYVDPRDLEVRFSAQKAALETQILQLKQKLSEVQKYNDELSHENKSLHNDLKTKDNEIEKQRDQADQISADLNNQLNELKKQLDHYKKLNRDAIESKAKADAEKAFMSTEIQQQNELLQQTKNEAEKLYELLDSRKRENESLAQDLSESRQEAAKYMRDFKDLETEYTTLNEKYKQLFKELEEIKRIKDTYKKQWEQSNTDLARKNKELIIKLEEVDRLRGKYEELLSQTSAAISAE